MIHFFKLLPAFFGVVLMSCLSCSSNDTKNATDPNFKVVPNTNSQFQGVSKKVMVFGIPIYAVEAVEDVKLLHAANILAQYLDNDENGVVDNQTVLNTMQSNNAFMVMWKKGSDFDVFSFPNNATGQDLGNDETIPVWHTNGQTGRFDASIEEVWHIITHAGYSKAYPEVFGEGQGTSLSNAMDAARGGQFVSIPNPYPDNAWYTYDDETCDYNCMTTEYFYWAMTSILGAQSNRIDEIAQEWDLNTKALVQTHDTAVYELLTDPQYKFPIVLPDGSYRH